MTFNTKILEENNIYFKFKTIVPKKIATLSIYYYIN